MLEWDTGISGGGPPWAEEIGSSKALNLERSLSCLRNSILAVLKRHMPCMLIQREGREVGGATSQRDSQAIVKTWAGEVMGSSGHRNDII